MSALLPWVAPAKVLKQLDGIGCWVCKQTIAFGELLTDVNSIRHATLKNCKVIDFLLSAKGHRCEEFKGMCCKNLSDHSKGIHCSTGMLKEGVRKLQIEQGKD